MSPTIFRGDGYRFFFFSREEMRKHFHVMLAEGGAKFCWSRKLNLHKTTVIRENSLKILKN